MTDHSERDSCWQQAEVCVPKNVSSIVAASTMYGSILSVLTTTHGRNIFGDTNLILPPAIVVYNHWEEEDDGTTTSIQPAMACKDI